MPHRTKVGQVSTGTALPETAQRQKTHVADQAHIAAQKTWGPVPRPIESVWFQRTGSALLLFLVGAGLFHWADTWAQPGGIGAHTALTNPPSVTPIVLSQVVGLALPSLGWFLTERTLWHKTRPRVVRHAMSGVLLGAALFYVLWVLLLPVSEKIAPWFSTHTAQQTETLRHLLRPGQRPPWADVVVFCCVPAFCEELFFRGALLRMLMGEETRAGHTQPERLFAVLVSALLFACLHASAVRFFPTLCLGLAFGFAAVRARSVVPAVVMHGVNNALVLCCVHHPGLGLTVLRFGLLWPMAVWIGFRLLGPGSGRQPERGNLFGGG